MNKIITFVLIFLCVVVFAQTKNVAEVWDNSQTVYSLEKPYYRQSIFSTQPNKEIVLKLVSRAENTGVTPLNISLVNDKDEVLATKSIIKVGKTVSFDGSKLAQGKYRLMCDILSPTGLAIKKPIEFTVLPKAENEVYFDDNGICYTNGKKFLPIGIYHIETKTFLEPINKKRKELGKKEVTTQNMFNSVEKMGFNTVLDYDMIPSKEYETIFNEAQKRNLKVVVQANWVPEPENYLDIIKTYKNNPALLAYSTWDEPHEKWHFEEAYKKKIATIAEDPYHPIKIAQCYTDLYGATKEICDVPSFDSYPYGRNEWWKTMPWWSKTDKDAGKNTARYLDIARYTFTEKDPFWFSVQASWGGSKTILYKLTKKQLEAQVWMALTHGSRGILYYAYFCPSLDASGQDDGGYFCLEDYPKEMGYIAGINKKLKELENVILAPGGNVISTNDSDLRAYGRNYKNKTYIFAVNIDDYTKTIEIPIKTKATKANVMWEKKNIDIKNGKIKDEMKPFDIRVYVVSN